MSVLVAPPEPAGRLATDWPRLRDYLAATRDAVAGLPPLPRRTAPARATAECLVTNGRRARARFLAVHAASVCDEATGGRGLRLDPVAYAIADAFPGLAPSRAEIEGERRHRQCDKAGAEVDQGILFWALLRVPRIADRLVDAMLAPTARAMRAAAEFRRSGRADLGTVRVRRIGSGAHLTVDNGRFLNAEDDRLVDDLETAIDLALLHPDVRVGVLRGAPMTHPRYAGRRVFSAGINLTHLYQGQISFVDFLLRREMGVLNKLVRGLRVDGEPGPEAHLAKPWLAAVDTFAIGGGMQLLLVCDRVVAERGARLSLPAAREGIVPGVANLRLGRQTGGRLARQVLLGGRELIAGEPAASTVVDDVVDAADLDAAVEAAAADLDNPAVAANRRMLLRAEEPPELFRGYLADFSWIQAHRLYSGDLLRTLERSWIRRERAR